MSCLYKNIPKPYWNFTLSNNIQILIMIFCMRQVNFSFLAQIFAWHWLWLRRSVPSFIHPSNQPSYNFRGIYHSSCSYTYSKSERFVLAMGCHATSESFLRKWSSETNSVGNKGVYPTIELNRVHNVLVPHLPFKLNSINSCSRQKQNKYIQIQHHTRIITHFLQNKIKIQ